MKNKHKWNKKPALSVSVLKEFIKENKTKNFYYTRLYNIKEKRRMLSKIGSKLKLTLYYMGYSYTAFHKRGQSFLPPYLTFKVELVEQKYLAIVAGLILIYFKV